MKFNLKLKPVAVIFAVAGFLLVVMAILVLLFNVYRAGPSLEAAQVDIKRGSGVATIAYVLEEKDVVRSPFTFRVWAKLTGKEKALHAGKYKFEPQLNVNEVLTKMHSGQTEKFKITFPEGLRTAEILAIMKADDSIEWDLDNVSAFNEQVPLLPETYMHDYGMKASALLEKMRKLAEEEIDAAWNARHLDVPINSKQELLTLASIVEKETSVDGERKEVAGVFVNRLNKGMRLQSDPTVIYGIKNYDGNIRRKDLNNPHPYNTYRHNGLPPGPIAHPGKASLWAVAQPNKTEHFYFVADGTGGHVFAKNLTQHNKNVQNYLEFYRNNIKNK